ncbi:MAG: hypothetical protein NUV64_00840 [Parcubacteria group bacterium]|nr:hypothetical protein [Parcubacteria group bacterium]MCR4342659.1 hypothetical protein [Patescibacteria group bacterium]
MMKKNIIIPILVIIIAGGLIYWYLNYVKPQKSEPEPITTEQIEVNLNKDDTTASINKAIDSIDLGDLDKEFQAIDTELQSL